jgi:hypothetical protein
MNVLPFGKNKGQPLILLSNEYVAWLAGFENSIEKLAYRVLNCDCRSCSQFITVSNSSTQEDVFNTIRLCFEQGTLPICIHEDERAWWWIYMSHRGWVYKARDEFKRRGICRICMKRLVPIGDRRKNGAYHLDWDDRVTHKSCWRQTL